MAHPKKKKRTAQPAPSTTQKPGPRPPKSMVLRLSPHAAGPSLTSLVHDFRLLMSPDTAVRLRERRANRLKDYLAMAGPLGVTHLFMFSRSKAGNVHLRVALTPRGPTLTYRVEGYTLARDILGVQKRPRQGGKGGEYTRAPLVVMNNFSQLKADDKSEEAADPIQKQLESLMMTVWQGIFPAITPSSTPLASIKRILLLNRENTDVAKGEGRYVISLRQYAITTRESGVSKKVRRFDAAEQRKREKRKDGRPLPNLGALEDAADYVLGGDEAGYTSASDTEMDSENEVEVVETEAQKVIGRKERQRQRQRQREAEANGEELNKAQPKSRVEKRAVKLVELGPRMKLRLVKVEEGICDGKVMWNEFVNKTEDEKDELDTRWKVRRSEKDERRRVQKENVERKRKERRGKGGDGDGGADPEAEALEYGSDFDIEDLDDDVDVDGGAAVDDDEGWESDDAAQDDSDGSDVEE